MTHLRSEDICNLEQVPI
jgi:hypothetical protein